MKLQEIEKKYDYHYSNFIKKLWRDGMLDWMRGWNEPWSKERNWYTEIYPKIKDNPPVLLHTADDFEMLSEDEILQYEFYEWWHKDHQFIPFGKTGAGDLYAFYKNIEINGENPIVLVWHDCSETQIISKNFEDFIFRKMIEKVVDADEIDATFKQNINADLKTIKKYLNPTYQEILTKVYTEINISIDEMNQIFNKTIQFDLLDTIFDQTEPKK